MIWILLVGGATMIVLSIPLEILGFWVYNHYGHPWKRFLSTDSLIEQRNNVAYPLEIIKSNGKLQHSRSKVNATLNTNENNDMHNLNRTEVKDLCWNKNEIRPKNQMKTSNFGSLNNLHKIHDISEATHHNQIDQEENVEEEKISLKARAEVNPLDESYEVLEKQLESLRLLKR